MLTESSCGRAIVWIGTKINNKQFNRTFLRARYSSAIANSSELNTKKKWHMPAIVCIRFISAI